MRVLIPFLLTACGESWTWDADNKLGDTGGGADSGTALHDLDGDGFTNIAAGGDDCWDDPSAIPAGFEAISGTAQPTAAEVHPDATETWYDSVDQDCAGDDDFDQDGDTHRSTTHADRTGATGDDCYDAVDDAYPSGAASCAREADLAPAVVYPGAIDAAYDGTDADCSGNDDFDQDGDTYGRCDECDDTNASIYPNDAPDVWYDGVDANCDGNDGDQDGDGYYVEGYSFTIPADYEAGDCVDTDAGTHPDAADAWYDGTDSNCLGDDDFDQDGDGYALADDCDDTVATTYPSAPDAWYDGVDSDCAGNDDFDQDFDGYDTTDDCDDTNATVNPAAAEDCATASDDDCDGDTNDIEALGCVVFYQDADGDGYGGMEACLCSATATYALGIGEDCDDGDADVNPAEAEVCNDGVDNDCDGGAGGCRLTDMSVSGAAAEYTGVTGGDYAGFSVAGAGDVDGDGLDDVVIGAPYQSSTEAGAAYLILGGAPGSASLSSAAAAFTGEVANDQAGWSVAGAGDVDGDGLADILVGARLQQDGATAGGAAYLILGGPPTSGSLSSAAAEFYGGSQYGYVGYSVAGVGDVDADGTDDMLVGSCAYNGGPGAAYLVLGGTPVSGNVSSAAIATYTGEAASDLAGFSVAGAGDVDGDGIPDMLIGAPMNDSGGSDWGAAFIVLGGTPVSGSLTTADATYAGESSSQTGSAVAGAGDVDGDGFDDVLIGAEYSSGGAYYGGEVYVILGGLVADRSVAAADASFTGATASERAGTSIGGAGDVDGDGFDDILIGASANSEASSLAGAAYLVLGGAISGGSLTSADAQFTGATSNARLGSSVDGAGDVDGDGLDDVVIGG